FYLHVSSTLSQNVSLVNKGCLTVDLHGGYYDHHLTIGTKKEKHCTALLVAIDLGVDKDPCLKKILDFVEKNDLHGIGIQSKEAVDHLISIPNIIKGLNLKYAPHYELVYLVCEDIFEAVYLNKAEWFQALDDIKKGQHYMIGSNFKILAFCSKSTVSAKARRFKQADLCIIKGANESINLTTWKSKKWPKPDLTKVAKVIRLAEAKRQGEKVQDSNLDQIGTLLNWFLHESLSFLSHGSFKKTDVLSSSLQLDEIMNLTIFCFDPQEKYLGDFSKDFETFRRVLSDPIKIEKSEFANKNGGKGDAIQGKS
ncbi:hypothetical protein M1M98_01275, partial [Thermodesulfovibrionales bacterium]|nr:hypothetical protein [Thermodesulfovibrionales bacterium]